MKKTYLFLLPVLALVAILAGCKSEPTQLGLNAQPSPQASAQPTPEPTPTPEVVGPAPAKFKATFIGTIDEKLNVQVELERDGNKLSGNYFYERAGAINLADKTLTLKGRIDNEGNITLGETTYNSDTDKEVKTGEFKGKLETVMVDGEPRLRFNGTWTGGKDKKTLAAAFRELHYDLGGLKLTDKKAKQANKKLNYELKTSLPQLAGDDAARADKFNKAVNAFVASRTGEFKKVAEEEAAAVAKAKAAEPATPPDAPEKKAEPAAPSPAYDMDVSYTVTAASKDFISILFYFYEFTGGAHPNTTTSAFNYDLNRNQEIKLADLFTPKSNYLKVISDYCLKELKKLKTVDSADEGASAKAENFDSWNITPAGLRITFDRYQVASYAAGDHEVVIPYSVLKPIIKPDGLLAQFAK
jgi:hypothetical protein